LSNNIFLSHVTHGYEGLVQGRIRNKTKSILRAIFSFCVFIQHKCKKDKSSIECIIFSKDRAMQLHALLSSFYEKVVTPITVHVLYQASNSSHQRSYEDLITIYHSRAISFIRQMDDHSFRRDFIRMVSSLQSEKIMFMVDDIIFIEDADLHALAKYDSTKYIPSLRMGRNIEFNSNLTPCWSPRIISDNKIEWFWRHGSYAWGYPLSLDGHIFLRQEILFLTRLISFKAPNSFETKLQKFTFLYYCRYGLAERKSVIVNIPCNKVQKENENRYGDIHQDYLLEKWQNGFQIDHKKFYGLMHNSTHMWLPLTFIARKQSD
jgi:hypothetical protein